jgi:alcohol dehydrogenase
MSTYYYVPSRNVFGEGSVDEVGKLMQSLGGTKAMIVTDQFLAAQPMTTRIQRILKAANVDSVVFGKAEPNPKDINVVEGEAFYHENGCNCILSLGGGSSHDCAKAIGLVCTNGGKIGDYEGVDRAHKALPPLVAVNTTAGTASEITRFCIITDTRRKVKMCIMDWRVTPAIAINDPELMVGMPPALTAATGMVALTHAVEAYVSTAANPLTDAAAIKAIDKIVHYLPQAVANGDYGKARSEMAYAQYLSGVAFNNASLGYVHAMAHQLGGYYDLPHGVCNAILLPYVEEFNLIGNLERFAVIARTMDINVDGMSPFEAGEACVYGLKTFSRYLGIPQNLRSLGVNPIDFAPMAENAMKDACAATNPRKATKDQIIAIYQKACDGD